MIPDVMGFDRAAPYLFGAFLVGYLIGALPVGLAVAKLFGLGDVRAAGSGNIGANNLLRLGGARAGAVTLLLDAAKGAAPAMIAFLYFGPVASACAGFGAFLGHCFSVYLRFWGGKGVATGFGVLLVWRWEVALICAAAWAATALLGRRASLASLAAALAAAALFPRYEEWTYAWPVFAMTAIIFLRHAGNIRRLATGAEPRIRIGGGGGGDGGGGGAEAGDGRAS
ncbi:MAG: glycerol-3-phosphate 1-O-acyltransferase PlsY [Pseudomonadota bacterium]